MNNEENYQFNSMLISIKKIMRNRKMTYKMLAAGIGMSESGLKKFFASKDGYLGRIVKICNFLEVDLNEILNFVKEREVENFKMDPHQEKFFINNWDYFCVFWKLFSDRDSVKKIMRENAISEEQMQKYLIKLDQFGFLEFHSINKVIVKEDDISEWIGDGPLVRVLKVMFSREIIERVIFPRELPKHSSYGINNYRFTAQTHEAFMRAVDDLNNEYDAKSAYETKVYKSSQLVHTSFVSAISRDCFIKSIKVGQSVKKELGLSLE